MIVIPSLIKIKKKKLLHPPEMMLFSPDLYAIELCYYNRWNRLSCILLGKLTIAYSLITTIF